MKDKHFFTKKSAILCAAFAAACFFLISGTVFHTKSLSGGAAVIEIDGQIAEKRPLTQSGEFTVSGAEGMVFLIENGGVRVKSSDCPDKICVKTGLVTAEYQSAVCLPNKVAVYVVSTDE
ncbi:MAG: NusG domain II-containing protein [Oscillospiraceae bacterium]|nr:NusG domain II-containing protein [Oscillospiraceae bacterium]